MRTVFRASRPSRGFTLVEMLVVISIIGILAAILIPTVMAAIRATKLSALALEVDRLSQSLEAYHLANKDYPPDFTNWEAVLAHVGRAYPRNTQNITAWLQSTPLTRRPDHLDPAEALVVWLSQTRKNPRDPLGISSTSGEPEIFFEFEETRLVDLDNDGWPEYVPQHSPLAPYVYFDGRIQTAMEDPPGPPPPIPTPTCAYVWAVYPMPQLAWNNPAFLPDDQRIRDAPAYTQIPVPGNIPSVGVVRPYISSALANDSTTWGPGITTTQWMEHRKFQIVCPGLDNNFGPDAGFKSFPDPNYTRSDEDDDNLPSFSEGATIADSVP